MTSIGHKERADAILANILSRKESATHTRDVVRFDEDVAAMLFKSIEALQSRVATLERRLNIGLQMTDAMFDIALSKDAPSFARYRDLADALGMTNNSTRADWVAAIERLKSS